MDQTMDTADLTKTEKYLNSMSSATATNTMMDSSEDSSSDIDDSAQDALLGGIRCGLRTMTRTARDSLSTCKNKTELDDAIGKIQASSLNLLKLEKAFLRTASIVSEVVDDLVSDFEEEEDDQKPGPSRGIRTAKTDDRKLKKDEIKGSGDASVGNSKQQPYVFLPSQRNVVSLDRFKDKLKQEYHKRMDEYKDSLTDEILMEDKKFEALLKQIKMGKNDAETAINNAAIKKQGKDEDEEGQSDTDSSTAVGVTATSSFISSLPYSVDELRNHKYKPYDKDEEMDDSVLPLVDPISKKLISYPVMNRYCNHVFDRASINAYIAGSKNAKCPVHMCRNNRKLERRHFVTDSVLTTHVRRKNNF